MDPEGGSEAQCPGATERGGMGMLNAELTGPKVRVEKLGTSDRGGGLLVAHEGQLLIRGKLRSRTLGTLATVQSLRFDDPDGQSAELVFQDLSRWAIEAEDPGLLEFAHQLQAHLGREGLVTDPPKLSQRVRTAMAAQGKRRVPEMLLALGLGAGVQLVVRQVAPLGWLLVAGGVGWVTLLGVALFQDEPPGWLGRLRATFERRGWALSLFLPMCIAFGAALGIEAATQRVLLDTQVRTLAAEAAEARQALERAEAERTSAHAAEVTAQVQRVEGALNAQRWTEAKTFYDALASLEPAHPALPTMWATLGPQLEARAAKEQALATEAALRDARRMQKDPVVCDDARAVAAAWKAVQGLPPTDPRRGPAAALVPTLERCRKIVARSLAINAAELRRQGRIQLMSPVQDELRRAGHLVNVELTGKAEDRVRISGDGLNAKAVPAITGQASRSPGSLFARLEEQGVRNVEVLAGERSLGSFALEPRSTEALAAELLTSMGLGSPLVLAEPAAAAP